MSDFVLDASLALQWFLEDESDRQYSLSILSTLSEKRAAVPFLWFYEIGNALLVAHRRKRITFDQIESFLTRLLALPIVTEGETASEVFELPKLAQRLHLTNYDAAYLALALRLGVPLATTDLELRRAAPQLSVQIFVP